ncbi:MAG: 50S ribosomal protein L24 [Lachnospiraceae bacterium]|nr:50S ribosomal protein L24 [Lachnospiraceae bacterium]
MATSKIKKGDTVRVITGKDKGREGKVTKVKDGKVTIDGINEATKSTKPSQLNPQGGITKFSAPLDISNVMLVSNGKVSRVGFKVENGNKIRYAKATGETLD